MNQKVFFGDMEAYPIISTTKQVEKFRNYGFNLRTNSYLHTGADVSTCYFDKKVKYNSLDQANSYPRRNNPLGCFFISTHCNIIGTSWDAEQEKSRHAQKSQSESEWVTSLFLAATPLPTMSLFVTFRPDWSLSQGMCLLNSNKVKLLYLIKMKRYLLKDR